jgi:hypothetical protein
MRVTRTYTEKEKVDCLKLWLVTGNLMGSANSLGIPFETVKTWRYSKWWNDLAVEMKADGRLELSAKLRKIAEKALGETLDRLENGDHRLSPTGEIQRIPVPAATAAKIATEFLDKSERLENVQDESSLQSVQDRLKALAESFEKFSKKVRKIEVIDVEPKQLGVEVFGSAVSAGPVEESGSGIEGEGEGNPSYERSYSGHSEESQRI